MPESKPHVALLWKKEGASLRCNLCNRHCLIPQGKRGGCGVRENQKGTLIALTYGRPCSVAVDPIEKKPFNHFWPGSSVLSLSTVGCNFHCAFCQNWTISQAKPEDFNAEFVEPELIVQAAIENNCQGIAYTYTEPTVFFEYCNDIAKLAAREKLYNVFVTNGYMTQDMLKLAKWMDAANVDLKSFSDEFYMKTCGGVHIQPILDNIKWMRKHKIHVEVTTLVVPGENDTPAELKKISEWAAGVDKDMPLHFSRFHPDYKMMDKQITPAKTLEIAYKQAEEAGVKYVYVGNIPGHDGESTYCPKCNHLLIQRKGFFVNKTELDEKKTGFFCPECGTKQNILGKIIR